MKGGQSVECQGQIFGNKAFMGPKIDQIKSEKNPFAIIWTTPLH